MHYCFYLIGFLSYLCLNFYWGFQGLIQAGLDRQLKQTSLLPHG